MGKGNGSTRSSASGNPRGLSKRGELPYTPAYRGGNELQAAKNEVEDLEYSIREIEAQKQELFDETDRLGREMERDTENEEYYRDQIMDLDREIDELDSRIYSDRVQIDRIKKQYNL